MDRREFIFGGVCVAALGGAEVLRPREQKILFADQKLSEVVPTAIPGWIEQPSASVIVPVTPGSLADQLYNETLVREYRPQEAGPPLMLLIAYGGVQNDLLQLHRPESCYPAIGFEITERRLIDIPLAPGSAIPAVMLTARLGERVEDIIYWTRLGDDLPQTAAKQRNSRLRAALAGYTGDGMLVRVSGIRYGATPRFNDLAVFLRAMIHAISPKQRVGFIGPDLTRNLTVT